MSLINNSKVYDTLKWTVLVATPLLIVFIQSLGLNFILWTTNGVQVDVVMLVSAAMALLGGLLGVSSAQYYKEQAK